MTLGLISFCQSEHTYVSNSLNVEIVLLGSSGRIFQYLYCKQSSSVSLSSFQICVGKLEDGETYLKLSSGKKRGLVPADSIEEI